MLNQKLFCCLGLSAIAFLGNGLPALSQEADTFKQPFEVRIVPPAPPEAQGSCFADLPGNIEELDQELRESNSKLAQDKQLSEEDIKHLTSLQSKRVELYYYRNADNMVDLLSKLPLGEGCVTPLRVNSFDPGQGVGRGGGNVMSLYGTEAYINHAQRFITSLDLPLPGIDLQLWGAQISSEKPDKLAKTTSKVRWRISETQRLLKETFATIQGFSQIKLQEKFQDLEKKNVQVSLLKKNSKISFVEIAKQLGYEDAIDGLGGESSILEVFLVGNTVEDTAQFYKDLYNDYLVPGKIENERFVADNEYLQPYFDALKDDINRPPFERIFRSRGLEPYCVKRRKDKDTENKLKCEKWQWKEDFVRDLEGKPVSLVDIRANFSRKVLLEFALHYGDFISNPDKYDPEELQRTADNLNELLQSSSNLLQKDIEDLFLKPTLAMIQEEVRENKGVEFAQVGRSTISTLDGVETVINTESVSGFQVSESQSLEELLARAERLFPTSAAGDASEAAEAAAEVAATAATGGIPVSPLLGLAIASLQQDVTPLTIKTGTSLAFTPGISRNLNSAELNIKLTVTDPTITPTAESNNVPPISRIGKQELKTTVYTQALDFFDLSTFTSQATLDGGRTPIPIIGNIWEAIFGAIPVFGDLLSFSNGNQNVLHESLILTNSFITPTPLSLGNLYSPVPTTGSAKEFDFCKQREELLKYLNGSDDLKDSNFMKPKIGGQASRRDTDIIRKRCSGSNQMKLD